MARDLDSNVSTAIAAPSVSPVFFYEGEFSNGAGGIETVRLWNGYSNVTWSAQTWVAAGQVIGFAPVEEASDLRASEFAVSLSGDSASLLALNLGYARQGLSGRVWVGVVDANNAIVTDPYNSFTGRLDVPDIVDDGEQCSISVRYESRLIDADRPRLRRYTDQDQKIDYNTDEGMGLVASIQQMDVTWGRR